MARYGASPPASINDAVNLAMDVANSANQSARDSITSSAPTLTAAQVLGGLLNFSGQTAAQAVTTPTATEIVAALKNAQVGQKFEFVVQNAHTSLGAITLTAGTGVTVTAGSVPVTKTQIFWGIVTAIGTPAVSIYGLLTAPV